MLRSRLFCGAAIVLASAAAASAAANEQFTSFDPAGSIYTTVAGINKAGTVAGYYEDSKGLTHGFVRTPDGTITAFDPPGATTTQVLSINDNGDVAGSYEVDSGTFYNFVRGSDGAITKFEASKGYEAAAIAINAKGKVAGWYSNYDYDAVGFVGMPGSKIRQLAVGGVAINRKGAVTGVDGSDGFVRQSSGKLTTFAGPGSPRSTTPTSINDSGEIAGYDETGCGTPHGFSRNASGDETSVDPPNSEYTMVRGINDRGAMTGVYYYGGYHGFVRSSGGTYTSFDVPGGTYGTFPQSINTGGVVAGIYLDVNDTMHGFVGTP